MFTMITPGLAAAYAEALLEEARRDQPELPGRMAHPGLRERLALRFGKWLISAGLWLQARYRPAIAPISDACEAAAAGAGVQYPVR